MQPLIYSYIKDHVIKTFDSCDLPVTNNKEKIDQKVRELSKKYRQMQKSGNKHEKVKADLWFKYVEMLQNDEKRHHLIGIIRHDFNELADIIFKMLNSLETIKIASNYSKSLILINIAIEFFKCDVDLTEDLVFDYMYRDSIWIKILKWIIAITVNTFLNPYIEFTDLNSTICKIFGLKSARKNRLKYDKAYGHYFLGWGKVTVNNVLDSYFQQEKLLVNDLYVDDYNYEIIHDFIVRYIDIEELSFILSHNLDKEEYSFTNFRNMSKQEMSRRLIEVATEQNQIRPLLYYINKLFLKDNENVIQGMNLDGQLEIALDKCMEEGHEKEFFALLHLLDKINRHPGEVTSYLKIKKGIWRNLFNTPKIWLTSIKNFLIPNLKYKKELEDRTVTNQTQQITKVLSNILNQSKRKISKSNIKLIGDDKSKNLYNAIINNIAAFNSKIDIESDVMNQIYQLPPSKKDSIPIYNKSSDDQYNFNEFKKILIDWIKSTEIFPIQQTKRFDPKIHKEIGTVPCNNEEDDGEIVQVVKFGFRSEDSVLQPAEVIVKRYVSDETKEMESQ